MKKNYIKYIILIIFNILIIRSFIIEPFRIPSGSMIPTLLPGDFIFVNKFIYGIKIPIINKKIISINYPKHGDIIVFKHKSNKRYIKRIIGIENDTITYKDKHIIINNKHIKNKKICKKIEIMNNTTLLEVINMKEFLSPNKEYKIQKYKNIKNTNYNYFNVTVPKNSYFVLGDNRDDSEDSRIWGFVEKKDIIGKAVAIWLSLDTESYIIRLERIMKFLK